MAKKRITKEAEEFFKKSKIYYVYILWDPLTFDPMYVGKGTDYRMKQHYNTVKRGGIPNGNNVELGAWIQKLIDLGLEPIYDKFYDNILDEQEAYRLERELILEIGLKHLLNKHANDWVYNPNMLPNDIVAPKERQIWGIPYNSLRASPGNSHAYESYKSGIIGIKGSSGTFIQFRKNIIRVKKGDIIFLYDNYPYSGVHAVCIVLEPFEFDITDSEKLWSGESENEVFSTRVKVEFINYEPDNVFPLKKIHSSDWVLRNPIINLTPKKDFTNKVFEHFQLDSETLTAIELISWKQKIDKWIKQNELTFLTYAVKTYSLITNEG